MKKGFTIGAARLEISNPATLKALIEFAETTSPEHVYEMTRWDDGAEWLRQKLPAFCDLITELNAQAQRRADDVDKTPK